MHDVGVLIPLFAIVGWIIIAVVRMRSRTRIRELEIRERIALIERGLVPPPDRDPEGFDRMMNRYNHRSDGFDRGPGRHRRTGIILMAVGFGLMMMIGLNDEMRHGLGVGGFLAFLGLGFFVSSLFETRTQFPAMPPLPARPAPPAGPATSGPDGAVPAAGEARP